MMNVRNEGNKAFEFQMLLHSYFKVKVSALEMCSAVQRGRIYSVHGTKSRLDIFFKVGETGASCVLRRTQYRRV